MSLINLLCRIAGFEPFQVEKHGYICPAGWHGGNAPEPRQKERPSEYNVVITANTDVALSTSLKQSQGEEMTFEALVKSGSAADTSGRVPNLTHADLRELAKRNVSQRTGERVKPLWCEGRTAAQIASATKLSIRTVEGAVGAFNAALPQVPAIAVAKH